MKRIFALLPLALSLATAAQAQTHKEFSAGTDGLGHATINVTETPNVSLGPLKAGRQRPITNVYGGYPSYAGGVPSYGDFNAPVANYAYGAGYGYNQNPGYGYGGGYGYNSNAGYGYANPYAYPPQSYYIPGQTTIYVPQTQTVITTNPPAYPYAGYNCPPAYGYGYPAPAYGYPAPGYGIPAPGYGVPAPGYGYGYSSRTTVSSGGFSYSKGGVSVNIGGSSVRRR